MAAGTMYSSTSIDNHSRDIRLVEILHNSSAQQSDTIECKLHRYSLDDCPQYTALSYTWGPANNSKEIRCNGLPLLIRDNLWKYLDEMRKQKDKRLFWIDAMSINQSNGVERTHQIRLMKDIYSKVLFAPFICSQTYHSYSKPIFLTPHPFQPIFLCL